MNQDAAIREWARRYYRTENLARIVAGDGSLFDYVPDEDRDDICRRVIRLSETVHRPFTIEWSDGTTHDPLS